MAKLSHNQIAEIVEFEYTGILTPEDIERENRREEKFRHPFYGLKDSRGWLTRYKLEEEQVFGVSREYAQEYVEAGLCFDINGVYGISPSWNRLEPVSTYKCLISLFGRIDMQDHTATTKMLELGLIPRSRREWHINEEGIRRREYAIKCGIETPRSIISLGRMTVTQFLAYCAKNGRLVIGKGYIFGCDAATKESDMYYISRDCDTDSDTEEPTIFSFIDSPACRKLEADMAKYVSRRDTPNHRWVEYQKTVAPNLDRLCDWSLKHNDNAYSYREFNPFCHARTEYTSEGTLYFYGDRILIYQNKKLVEVKSRNYAGQHLFHIGSTYFLFSSDMKEHVEGKNLKELYQIFTSRKKKGGLIFSLNNVRNDRKGTAGFCLAGTKAFLKDRMPFLYRLIQKYSEWSKIPSDIMSVEFELCGHEVFAGYPHP